ncbi:MAG: hypothetical protein Tsb0010_05620 [Parvularculaceae bacterium]
MFGDLAKSFVSFDELMGEGLVRGAYYVGAGVIALLGMGRILEALASGIGDFLGALLFVPFAALFALIAWRIICEAVITVFRIQARLDEIIEQEQTRPYSGSDAEAA